MIKKLAVFIFILQSGLLLAQDRTLVLEDINPSGFNLDFNDYDQKTAVFCAQVANMLYYDLSLIDLRINLLQAKYPEQDIRYQFIHESRVSDTQNELLFFGTKRFVLIAFRGTSSIKDWKTDLRRKNVKFRHSALQEKYRVLPAGHAGFRKSLINLMDQGLFEKLHEFISQYTDQVSEFPVYLTGHSLGGALATLCIKPLTFQNQFSFQGCYNFAPALAISCTDNEEIEKKFGNKVYDIVNYVDFVSRTNYKKLRHIGKFYRMTKEDQKRNCDVQSGLLFHQHERLSGFSFVEGLIFPKTVYKYHSLDSYVTNLKLKENSAEKIALRGFDQGCHYKKEDHKYEKRTCHVKRRELKNQKINIH